MWCVFYVKKNTGHVLMTISADTVFCSLSLVYWAVVTILSDVNLFARNARRRVVYLILPDVYKGYKTRHDD